MKSTIAIRYKKRNVPAVLLCIGFFVFPVIMREMILPEKIYFINYLSFLAVIMIIRNNRRIAKIGLADHRKHYSLLFVAVYSVLLIAFLGVMLRRGDYMHCMTYVVAILIPILFIDIDFRSRIYFEGMLKVWVRGLLCISYFMASCGIVDLFSGSAVTYFFANLYPAESLDALASSGRMVSYLGHALLSSEIFLITYITYHLYTVVYAKEKEKIFNFLIMLLGVAFTGSKTGLVLLLLYFIFTHANWKNRKIMSGGAILMVMMYWVGLFDTVINRILTGLQMGDLSTNRNTALQQLLTGGVIKFDWLNGQNIEYSSWKMVAALEYPILRWAYQFGIIVSACLFFLLFIYPLLKMLRAKSKIAYIIGSAAIMACVNSYNGMAQATDHVFLYCIAVMFIVNMATFEVAVKSR